MYYMAVLIRTIFLCKIICWAIIFAKPELVAFYQEQATAHDAPSMCAESNSFLLVIL